MFKLFYLVMQLCHCELVVHAHFLYNHLSMKPLSWKARTDLSSGDVVLLGLTAVFYACTAGLRFIVWLVRVGVSFGCGWEGFSRCFGW